MNKTRIETADYTFQPTTGCDNRCFGGDCYAYCMVKRFGRRWGYGWKPEFHPEHLAEPLSLRRPSMIFGPSMGDLYTTGNSDPVIRTVLDSMGEAGWHRFQVQTKFAERLPDFSYPPNVWLGVSLCYAGDTGRLDCLRRTNARVKYAYCEPLLEDMKPDFTGVDWVVIGAKTGTHPSQPNFLWIQKLTILAYEVGARVYHKRNLGFLRYGNYPPPIRQFPDPEWEGWKTRRKRA